MHTNLNEHLPFLIETLSNADSTDSIDARWESILKRFYSDYKLILKNGSSNTCQLTNDDMTILVPCIENKATYELTSNNPDSTFTDNDVQLVTALLKLTHQFISNQQAIEIGASEERQRIARDLHDDVAARMLTLIHQAKDQHSIDLARSILKSLRNAIYTLDNKSTTTIIDAITDVRSELQERLNAIGMQIFWSQSESINDQIFTPRQHINLNRIMHEIVTNVIRHAHAEYVTIDVTLKEDQFSVQACDNGTGFNKEACIPGKGINNITTRINELDGIAHWNNINSKDNDNTGCCIDISFPITIK